MKSEKSRDVAVIACGTQPGPQCIHLNFISFRLHSLCPVSHKPKHAQTPAQTPAIPVKEINFTANFKMAPKRQPKAFDPSSYSSWLSKSKQTARINLAIMQAWERRWFVVKNGLLCWKMSP